MELIHSLSYFFGIKQKKKQKNSFLHELFIPYICLTDDLGKGECS